jgi:hypothetical protein
MHSQDGWNNCRDRCNDVRALQILQACQRGGQSVPDEVAVLGVDNDEIITELSHPKLSSIQPDTVSTGYKACVCLDKMMRGVKVSRAADHTAPLAAIERESTNTIATAVSGSALGFSQQSGGSFQTNARQNDPR